VPADAFRFALTRLSQPFESSEAKFRAEGRTVVLCLTACEQIAQHAGGVCGSSAEWSRETLDGLGPMWAKSALRRALPAPLVGAGAWTLDRVLPARRATRNALRSRKRSERVASELIARKGPVVQGGPFAGLRLPAKPSWGPLAPLLVGSYEQELHPLLEELIAARPYRIVNVGCAEGYYAVGFARRLPEVEVYAFDIDERARRLAHETAESNGVAQRVQIAEACTVGRLEELVGRKTLVIVDCEGCELELLHPDRVPSLRFATVLVELHDFVDPTISSAIFARFRKTHSIDVIGGRDRTISDYPMIQDLEPLDRAAALSELRPTDPHPMQWAVLYPLA
jgi:Methyltransferase small domain